MVDDIPNCERCGVSLDYAVFNWGWYIELDDPRYPKCKGEKYCMRCYLYRYPFVAAKYCDRSWPTNPSFKKFIAE